MAAKRVCLAYSGGLDTSVILAWLIEQGYTVVAFLADVVRTGPSSTFTPQLGRQALHLESQAVSLALWLVPYSWGGYKREGQNEDYDAVKAKAAKIGAERMIIQDLQQELVEELVWPAVQCNALYEDAYLLGTSLARPVIARAMMKVAKQYNCEFLSHGCQIRAGMEGPRSEDKDNHPVAHTRVFGRQALLDFAESKGVPVTSTKQKPFSMDANLIHCSYEAGLLEQPELEPPADMWTMTVGKSHEGS
ncbi:hypothetical protein O1611_g4402 [Lasiodiplodia mahajangana]|uniref:Uncharacterized protein n=1 Tax=Lasiodiplodia mahajangana TaxID=1108764 RepID=A0ACC2JP25_9PEZI|nr:hypothetical protein O1611_g4402 [Lasiodiplodia mahajangana]